MWAEINKDNRIRQGDVFRNVEYVESVTRQGSEIVVSVVRFPLVLVLTQDCDLASDFRSRFEDMHNPSKCLISVIVAPLYNEAHFQEGSQLMELDIKSEPFSAKSFKRIQSKMLARYHYLPQTTEVPQLQPLVVDFKHYFTVAVSELERIRESNFVCKIKELYREDLSIRFAQFLSRIGLPETIGNEPM